MRLPSSAVVKIVRSVAKDQEAHGACFGDDSQLGAQSSVRDPIGMFHLGHRRHRLYTMGNLPRRRGAEVVGSCRDFHWISSAAVADDLLLFAHCVRTAYQGNNTSSPSFIGVTRGCTCTPQGGEKNKRNLQGKFVSAHPAHQVHPLGRAGVKFWDFFAGRGFWRWDWFI